MNNAQRRPDPTVIAAPPPPAATPAEARKLAEAMMEVMNTLLAVIEQETALVRAGKVREALKLEQNKNELSQRYIAMITLLKASQKYLAQTTPDLLSALHRHHDVFRAMLQVNLTVLATAHAVSEGIVRGVNNEIQKRNIPQTYTAMGRNAQPGRANRTPIVVNRTM
jgi:ATP-dependent DNA ligase